MTREEALVFLGIDSAEDLQDGFDTALFELKQFFLGKPVFTKTAEGKWAKLERIDEAFETLGGKIAVESEILWQFTPQTDLREHFLAYHREKNKLRQGIAVALSGKRIRELSAEMIRLEQLFAEPFVSWADWTEEQVVLGKEPDTMEVLAWLTEQAAEGRTTLEKLYTEKNSLPAGLLLALKRLSLLKNYL